LPHPLKPEERIYYRDNLRAARYAALADAEGFASICFAVEALGCRLLEKEETMGAPLFVAELEQLAAKSTVLSDLSKTWPAYFASFGVLFDSLKDARNMAMHTGVYARHVTTKAIDLCIGLEEALMNVEEADMAESAANYMVKTPISLEPWQPVARARQIMLTHSFSFLPVYINNKWMLLSEIELVKFLRVPKKRESNCSHCS